MAMAVEDVGAAAAVAAEAGIENQIRENQGTTSRSAPSVNWRTRALTRTGLAVARVRSLDSGDCVGKDRPLAEAKRGYLPPMDAGGKMSRLSWLVRDN
jgi:hypothetical protein